MYRAPADGLELVQRAQAAGAGPDFSVKAGGMTSQAAAALAAARFADRSQRGPQRSVGDASVRFGNAHVAHTQEGFAQHFGPYAGELSNFNLALCNIASAFYAPGPFR